MPTYSVIANLSSTLDSGQLFRYFPENDGFRVLHRSHSFFIKESNGEITAEGISSSKLASFLRLDDKYEEILAALSNDPHTSAAIKKYPGLRLLRQDPWECTISFLCSSATNIPRIKRDLNNIAQTFGKEKDGFFLFPKPGEIDNLEKIKRCGTGFRAKYIYEVNNSTTPSFFKKLRNKKYGDAHHVLMELPGIGPKVADCILLFSCDHLNAFPIDTWMEKVLREHYSRTEKSYEKLSLWARTHFGEYAGYAQQFLYHWKRTEKA